MSIDQSKIRNFCIIAHIEERVKTGRLTDILAVELFIVKYSSVSKR